MPEIAYEITVSKRELSLIRVALIYWQQEFVRFAREGVAAAPAEIEAADALLARLRGDHPKLEPEPEIERARRLR